MSSEPVRVEGNSIIIEEPRLQVGSWKEIEYKGKKYLIHIPRRGVIEMYEKVESKFEDWGKWWKKVMRRK